MARAFILVIDSFGIGHAPDAEKYGDKGANTLLHIAQACASGKCDGPARARKGALTVPNLRALGLEGALELASGQSLPADGAAKPKLIGAYAAGEEISAGKDTPSGHWEMMGLPVETEWGFFHQPPADKQADYIGVFPRKLLERIYQKAGLKGSLGNEIASGTEIIARLGEEHLKTGLPIFYTSTDSVFQVAAHERIFPLERLYALCEIIRAELEPYNVGRVIARPFVGDNARNFRRSNGRRDWTTPPEKPTLFDAVQAAGGETIAIGKIADIFAHQGISKAVKAYGTPALFEATMEQVKIAPEGSLTMTNFVDFDQNFGHRRDIAGYGNELEVLDALLPQLLAALRPRDLLVITADHGCDPTWRGNDHTREYVPQLFYSAAVPPGSLGRRKSFAGLGQSVAAWLGAAPLAHGESYLAPARSGK